MQKTQTLKQKISEDIQTGQMLRKLRTDKGIQAKFVSECLDVTAGFLSDLEHGRRHWTAERITAYKKAIGV